MEVRITLQMFFPPEGGFAFRRSTGIMTQEDLMYADK